MSLFTSGSTYPIITIDLISRILSHLAQPQFEESYDHLTLRSVQACSLVCKLWVPECQRILFERIGDIDATDPDQPRLKRLCEILVENPSLSGFVHELSITVSTSDPPSDVTPSTQNTLKPLQNILLQFPNVVSLTIAHRHSDITSFKLLNPFAKVMIFTYLRQPSLRRIHLQNIAINPTTDIWTDVLKSLNIHQLSISSSDSVTDPLLNLSFNRNPQPFRHPRTSLDFLRHFELSDVLVPMLDHTLLRCYYQNTIEEVIDNLTTAPNTLGVAVDALRNIEVFDVNIDRPDDTTSLRWLLEHMPCLKTLVIDAPKLSLNQSRLLPTIRPSHNQQFYFTDLQNLTLTLVVDTDIGAYQSAMADLQLNIYGFCNTLNVLESISISLRMAFSTSPQSILQPWKKIANTLASEEYFPKLKRVDVSISLSVPHESARVELLQEFGGEEELKYALQRAMRVLHRPSMEVSGVLSLVQQRVDG